MAGSDHWNTPGWLADLLLLIGGNRIALDPCSNATSRVKADVKWYGPPGLNGLLLPWLVDGLVFVNPPYTQKHAWVRKCFDEAYSCRARLGVIALIPADTDTEHFQRYCKTGRASARCFFRGRLVHEGVDANPDPARFPSVLVYWKPPLKGAEGVPANNVLERFRRVLEPHGWVC